MPCPIPFFEAQAAYLAEHWALPNLTSAAERLAWVAQRQEAVGARTQDTHLTSPSAWAYMRELIRAVHDAAPPEADTSRKALAPTATIS